LILLLAYSNLINSDEVESNQPPLKSRFTKKIDVDKIEKSWQKGDGSIELENEYEHQAKVAAKRSKNKGMSIPSDPNELAKAIKKDPLAFKNNKSSGAAVMFFVDLRFKRPNGRSWTKKSVDTLAKRWTSLLTSGSLGANVFNIGDKDGEGKLLVNVEKGWNALEAMKFVASQPETLKLTRDNKDYTAADLGIKDPDDDDDDDDEL
jgi:hypothetical protein